MPTDGYMDAAAIGTPDGDDRLRMALARTLARANRPNLTNPAAILAEYESWLWAADALLPLIRDRIAAAVQAERERHKLTTDTLRSYAEARSKSTSEAVRLTAEGVLQILDGEANP